MKLANDAVTGTYAWIEQQGLSPVIMQRIKVIANQSLRLGMMMTITKQNTFKKGLEEELKEEDELCG
jgi:hypothetical protein